MTQENHEIQGRLGGFLPYDFRTPTLAKFARRMFQPKGPMLVPKVFGVGWTLNWAHGGTWLLLGTCLGAALLRLLVG